MIRQVLADGPVAASVPPLEVLPWTSNIRGGLRAILLAPAPRPRRRSGVTVREAKLPIQLSFLFDHLRPEGKLDGFRITELRRHRNHVQLGAIRYRVLLLVSSMPCL
jgi:hypothetical protein